MAMNTAVRAKTILLLTQECVVFELMMSMRGLNLVEHLESSPILNEIIMLINSKIKFHPEDHVIHETLMDYKKLVETGEINLILERFLKFPKSFN
jgi:histidine ammonia-lyase